MNGIPPQCQEIQDQIDAMKAEIGLLQEDLQGATSSQKPGIIARITADQRQLRKLEAQLKACLKSKLIETGGPWLSPSGSKILVTQGVTGSKLVAGKQILIGFFLSDRVVSRIQKISYVIRGPLGTTVANALGARNLVRVNAEASGVILPGTTFPRAGNYIVTMRALDLAGVVIAQTGDTTMTFRGTKDLRLHVSLIVKPGRPGLEADASWYADLEASLQRLNAMLPVRDGVAPLNADSRSGIRYITTECDGWGDFATCTYGRTRQINASTGDHIDITVEWRPGVYSGPNQTDDGPGGNSGRPPAPYSDLLRASCVTGVWRGVSISAPGIMQEIGHNFGLEPPGSPHYQDPRDPGHSKDGPLGDPYAFDFIRRRSFTPGPDGFVGDLMNNMASGVFQGNDSTALNAYDFNYMLDQLQKLPSTGTETHP
jgi:hypothetical protein